MSNCLLDEHCINCELFLNENELHKNVGNYGSNGFNVSVLDAIFYIYGFSAKDLAFAHLNLNFESDENILEQKELSEVTSYISQQGLPLCSTCVLSIKQVFINHAKLKKEASEFSLLSKVLKRNRQNPEIKIEVDLAEESEFNYDDDVSQESTFKTVRSTNTAELHDTTERQAKVDIPDQSSSQEFEPTFSEFEDFDSLSDAEDIKVDPFNGIQIEDQVSPNCDTLLVKMKPCSIVLHRINSGTAPFSRRRVFLRKQYNKTFSIKKKRKERPANHKPPIQHKKTEPPSRINRPKEKFSASDRNPKGYERNVNVTKTADDRISYCEPCDMYFKRVSHFNTHQRMKHNVYKTNNPGNSVLEENSSLTVETDFKCGCGFPAYTMEALKRHVKICKSDIALMCDICGQLFKKSYLLYAHKKTDHSEIHPLYPKCKFCDTVFVWRSSWRNHIDSLHSTDGQSFVCDKCGRSFKTLANMNRHRRQTHIGVTINKELFRCKQCGILLKHGHSLKRHIQRMHSENQKIITCAQCGKTTKTMTNMRIHMKVHDPNRTLKINKPSKLQKTT